MKKNSIGTVIFCLNRYPENLEKPYAQRKIVGYTLNGLILDFPVIWSNERIRGLKEDGYDVHDILYHVPKNKIGKTDQNYVPKKENLIIP